MLIRTKNISTGKYTEALAKAWEARNGVAHQQIAATSWNNSKELSQKDRESYKKALLGVR